MARASDFVVAGSKRATHIASKLVKKHQLNFMVIDSFKSNYSAHSYCSTAGHCPLFYEKGFHCVVFR